MTDLRERLQRVGHLDVLKRMAAAIDRYQRALAAIDPRLDDAAAGQRAAALEVLGDVRRDEGDVAGAYDLYRASLALRERMARLDPDGDWGEGLLSSRLGIGAALRQQGDLSGALVSHAEGLQRAEALAARDGGAPIWRYWQARFHRGIADVDDDRDDVAASQREYQIALAIVAALACASPPNHAGSAIWPRPTRACRASSASSGTPPRRSRRRARPATSPSGWCAPIPATSRCSTSSRCATTTCASC
jgi:tetratricopeptide (TPR) repeat protein